MQTIILHIDMNSYFASVAQQDNSLWRGMPLGVCEHLGGIIIAASREAKKWGIKTGTPVWEAKKLYPKIILTNTLPERYRFYTRKFIQVLSEYTDKVEIASIDEAYIDVTRVTNIRVKNEDVRYENHKKILYPKSSILNYADPFLEAINVAKDIKQKMKTEVGEWLTCSIGIAENKLLAKIGSDMQKPDGMVVILNSKSEYLNPKQIQNYKFQIPNEDKKVLIFSKEDLYKKLKLTDIPGIGRRQEKNLNNLGINTLLDLKNTSKNVLFSKFGGIGGHHIYNIGQLCGSFKPSVEKQSELKSIGHMYTLPKEFREARFFEPVLYKLCEMVGKRLRKKKLQGNVLHLYVRSEEKGKSFGTSKILGFYVWDGRDIFLQAVEILKSHSVLQVYPPVVKFKLIGITVAGLGPIGGQKSLFGEEEKQRKTVEALDKINAKYGDFTVFRAPVLKAKKVFHDSVGFGRVKEL
jgi:DNA polymerase IV